VPIALKYGSLSLLEHSGFVQAFAGIALPSPFCVVGIHFSFFYIKKLAAAAVFALKHSICSVTWLPKLESARKAPVQEVVTEKQTLSASLTQPH
jgi:hypothetical protein